MSNLIAGGGFALMAWREAIRRCGGHHYDQLHRYEPTERENTLAESGMYPVSEEFYRILDRVNEYWPTRPRCGGTSVTVHL